jgi:hypothetical protein
MSKYLPIFSPEDGNIFKPLCSVQNTIWWTKSRNPATLTMIYYHENHLKPEWIYLYTNPSAKTYPVHQGQHQKIRLLARF